jgi:hypothetical protein
MIRYCFGDSEDDATSYMALLTYSDEWMAMRPASFSPMFFKEAQEGEAFPAIWLLNDAVTTGLQHYHLGRILLSAHNPKAPRLGPAGKAAVERADDEIRAHVRTICGMALSNSQTPPNLA